LHIEAKQTNFGKKIAQTLYFSSDAIALLSINLHQRISQLLDDLGSQSTLPDFNIIKLNLETQQLSLLLYEDFQTHHFPCLISSHSVDIQSKFIVSSRSYNICVNGQLK